MSSVEPYKMAKLKGNYCLFDWKTNWWEINILETMREYLNKIVAFGLLSIALHAGAQKPAVNNYNPPRAPLPRYLEDYSTLDTLDRDRLYLHLKYLPAGKNSNFSFGGETRQRYEYYHNYRFGQADQDPNGSDLPFSPACRFSP